MELTIRHRIEFCSSTESVLHDILSALRDLKTTVHDIKTQGNQIMSAISDFVAKQQAHNDKISAGIDGIAGDIQVLNDKITALQNSQGQITPEDQALLDDIEAKGSALADRVAALDDLNPPVPPPT